MRSSYLLSGLLHCGICGTTLNIVGSYRAKANRPERRYYGCPINYRQGRCANGIRILHLDLEKQILARLQQQISEERVIAYILDQFEWGVIKALADSAYGSDGLRRRRMELEGEVRRLAVGLARGTQSPAVIAEINHREREIATIDEKLPASNPPSVRLQSKKLRAAALGRVHNLRECLSTDPGPARMHFLRYTERIDVHPDGSSVLVARSDWNLLGIGS
jgi:hypothetical protein